LLNQNQSPDIRFFDRSKHLREHFARYDYMGVLPPLNACTGFLKFCDDCRGNGFKLPPKVLKDELRAYESIKDKKYVANKYSWER